MFDAVIFYIWFIGALLFLMGIIGNAETLFYPKRPDWDLSSAGIKDRIRRRAGPIFWRIGLVILVLTTPLLIWVSR